MRRKLTFITLLVSILSVHTVFAGNLWTPVSQAQAPAASLAGHCSAYAVYTASESTLRDMLFALPSGFAQAQRIALPMPDGSIRYFKTWSTSMMEPALAARYPQIRTFTAIAEDDPSVTAKLDYTVYGFHAMIFGGKDIVLIDPLDDNNSGYYTAHYKKDETRRFDAPAACVSQHIEPIIRDGAMDIRPDAAFRIANGQLLRTYRLALACSYQYAFAVTSIAVPTIAQVFSKMTTSMNRINGVYERELSITMTFVAKEDTLIFTKATGGVNGDDPFYSINNNANACIDQNQLTCDDRIGKANYDVGHVFTTGAGGFSLIGVICDSNSKAKSVTGRTAPLGDAFDIDFVAHEMGHEFGADHPFNDGVSSNCGGGNINAGTAYEPGSGSTIMAYAGICDPDDIQPHSDDYFHAVSLYQVQNYITSTQGNSCGVKTATNNKLVYLPPFTASYYIPYLTPFELLAPTATDSVSSSSITYCWEQWNLGDVGQTFSNTHNFGPIFRSYTPSASPLRIFPRIGMVLAGELSDAGIENAQGEKAPDVARYLTFKLTMRNLLNGYGCFLFPDDSIHLDVINTGAGFKVTSQTDSTATYVGNSTQTITWDVVGTNNAPINASTVDIFMSEDGGYTWPHQIGTFPNTGSATVPLPNPDTTTLHARIKVKGTGNVFFNVNKSQFSVTHSDGVDTSIRIYPVPTHSTLRISSGNKGMLQFRIYDAAGGLVFSNVVNGLFDVPVHLWARGNYIIRMVDTKGQKTVKKFVVD